MSKPSLNTFWDGPSNPYMRLCLATWIAHGFEVNVYATNPHIVVPAGARVKRPEDVLDLAGHVHRYKRGFGAGSAALHANLFRYHLTARGEWWLDADVLLLRDDLPADEFFLCFESTEKVGTAVMRLPEGSPVSRDAIHETEAAISKGNVKWAETGPQLITSLAGRHSVLDIVSPKNVAYEIGYKEIEAFFDHSKTAEVKERLSTSTFVHLWNQIWHSIGYPAEFGPPGGSYLDSIIRQHGQMHLFFAGTLPAQSVLQWCRNLKELRRLRAEAARINPPPGPRAFSNATELSPHAPIPDRADCQS